MIFQQFGAVLQLLVLGHLWRLIASTYRIWPRLWTLHPFMILSQIIATKLEADNDLKCLCMLWCTCSIDKKTDPIMHCQWTHPLSPSILIHLYLKQNSYQIFTFTLAKLMKANKNANECLNISRKNVFLYVLIVKSGTKPTKIWVALSTNFFLLTQLLT